MLMLLERDRWKGMSSRAIAEAANVDHKIVASIKEFIGVGNSPPGGDRGYTFPAIVVFQREGQ